MLVLALFQQPGQPLVFVVALLQCASDSCSLRSASTLLQVASARCCCSSSRCCSDCGQLPAFLFVCLQRALELVDPLLQGVAGRAVLARCAAPGGATNGRARPKHPRAAPPASRIGSAIPPRLLSACARARRSAAARCRRSCGARCCVAPGGVTNGHARPKHPRAAPPASRIGSAIPPRLLSGCARARRSAAAGRRRRSAVRYRARPARSSVAGARPHVR